MKKLSLCLTVLALFVGAAAMLPNDRQRRLPAIEKGASPDASAAFRDGLYLGKLAAKRGAPMRLASGRWSTLGDRALFALGYEQGYHESVARVAASGEGRRAE
jgi:hypothetical protein